MGMTEIGYSRDGGVARITLVGPDRLNALATSTCDGLRDRLDEAVRDQEVRVIVLDAVGRAFCVGADLKEMAERDARGEAFETPVGPPGRTVFEVLLHTWKPTVAALNGLALGAGCELALACDVRLASDSAEIALPEARRGMGAAFGSVMLPRLVPRGVAFDLLYTGRRMLAREAYAHGLVSDVVPDGQLATATARYADLVAGNAPLSVQRFKHSIVKTAELPVTAALRQDVGPDPYQSADRVEGALAFVERRRPRFTGR